VNIAHGMWANYRRKDICIEKEKCIKQRARNAIKNVKYRSSRTVQGLFTAGTATKSTDHHEDSSPF
jgi:hypothetical protein